MICLFMKVYIRKGIYIARNLSPNLQLKTHRKKNSCCKCHHQPPHHQSHVCFSSIRSSPNLGSWRLKCWKIETWEVRGFDRFAICQIYKSNQPQKIKRFKKRHQLPNEQLVSSFGNLDFLSTHLLSSAKLTASLGSPTARLGGAQAWRSSDKKMEEIGFLVENVFFFKNLPLFFLEILPWPDQPRLSRQALHGMLYPSFPQRSCLFKTRGTSWKLVKLYYAILFMKKRYPNSLDSWKYITNCILGGYLTIIEENVIIPSIHCQLQDFNFQSRSHATEAVGLPPCTIQLLLRFPNSKCWFTRPHCKFRSCRT